jgi:hypothetical protein
LLLPDSPSLAIERSARSQFAVVASVGAILALIPWWLPRLSVMTAAVLATSALALAAVSFWRIGWLGSHGLRKAVWATDGNWWIVDHNGVGGSARLLPESRVMGAMVWLCFVNERGPRHMLFMRTELPPGLRRRLVTRLRLQAARQLLQIKQRSGKVTGVKGLQP